MTDDRPRGLGSAVLPLVAITGVALALRVALIADQPLLADDVAVGRTALNFSGRGWPYPTMWNHPRLRDLLVAGSLAALGHGPVGLKLWSLLLGTLAVPTTYALVRAAGGAVLAALVAAGVVAFDPLHVDFSRQAINDVHLSFFPVAAAAALLAWRRRRDPALLAAAGVLLGLGIATKWSAAFPVAAAAFVTVGTVALTDPTPRGRADVALAAVALAVVPLAIYVATYWPWLGRGHGLGDLVGLHRLMALETATHVGYAGTKHPGYAGEVFQPWRWFVQPVWYVDVLPPPGPGAPPVQVIGLANPVAWLAVLPATALALWRAARGDAAARTVALLFLAAYVPFLVVQRPIWTNSAVGVLPFAAAVIGLAAERIRFGAAAAVWAWAAVALAAALALWPPAIGARSRATDALVHAIVPPEAFLPPPRHP